MQFWMSAELGQASAYQHDREASLRGTVEHRNQGGQLHFVDVLEFVHEKDERSAGGRGGKADRLEQRLQVILSFQDNIAKLRQIKPSQG